MTQYMNIYIKILEIWTLWFHSFYNAFKKWLQSNWKFYWHFISLFSNLITHCSTYLFLNALKFNFCVHYIATWKPGPWPPKSDITIILSCIMCCINSNSNNVCVSTEWGKRRDGDSTDLWQDQIYSRYLCF